MSVLSRYFSPVTSRTVVPVVDLPEIGNGTVWPTKISILRLLADGREDYGRAYDYYFTIGGKLAQDFVYLTRLFRRAHTVSIPPESCNGQSGRLYWIFRNGDLYFRPVFMRDQTFTKLTLAEVKDLASDLGIYPYPALQPTDPYYKKATADSLLPPRAPGGVISGWPSLAEETRYSLRGTSLEPLSSQGHHSIYSADDFFK